MNSQLDIKCDTCAVPLTVTTESAAHDNNLIDIVVSCESCGCTLNAFVCIDEMRVLNKGREQEL
ncbi:hypothetical protein [Pseudomonas sp. J380]|uniref:hypothetical protein n=1 Tax=Pseudomonas sp. J380 TaxID=2605424 RepID=UPI001317F0C9|nr:hypothetical protein [Pseudomonas sp. J380]QHA95818.1 hypothetical protein FXO12_03705 [Pseudomonas sp. J380]